MYKHKRARACVSVSVESNRPISIPIYLHIHESIYTYMCEFVCVCVYLLCVYVYICIYFRYNHYNYMQKISRTYSTVFNLVKPDDVRPPQCWKKWYLWINWIFHNKTWIIVKNGEKKSLILRKFVSEPLIAPWHRTADRKSLWLRDLVSENFHIAQFLSTTRPKCRTRP